MLQSDTQTALTAAATIFTVIDLNIRVCCEVIFCVTVVCVEMTNPKVNGYKLFTRMLTEICIITVLQPKSFFCFENTSEFMEAFLCSFTVSVWFFSWLIQSLCSIRVSSSL